MSVPDKVMAARKIQSTKTESRFNYTRNTSSVVTPAVFRDNYSTLQPIHAVPLDGQVGVGEGQLHQAESIRDQE